MKYCLGFYFSEGLEQVLLIKKQRPDFLAGKFNGIGGKVNESERERHAMIRKFKEECGIDTYLSDWFFAGTHQFENDDQIYVFYGFGDVTQAKTLTDEVVHIISVDNLQNVKVDDLALSLIHHILKISSQRH